MSEEIDNAAVNVPRAIFTTMILNGATGFAMVLAVLFCIADVDSVVVSSPILRESRPVSKIVIRTRQPSSRSSKSSITEQNPTQEPQP